MRMVIDEDAYLLAAMEEVKDEAPVSKEEAFEFEQWLTSAKKHTFPEE